MAPRWLFWPGSPQLFVDSSLKLHVDDTSHVLTSGRVSQWTNLVSGGINLGQGNAGQRPTTGTFNGRPVVRFESSGSNSLIQLSGTMADYVTAGEYHAYIIARMHSITAAGTPAYNTHGIWADTAGFLGLYASNYSPNRVSLYNWDTNADFAASTNIDASDWRLFECYHAGGSIGLVVDDDTVITAASGDTDDLTGFFRLGIGWLGGGQFANVSIATVLVYNRELTVGERAQTRAYLAHRWGVTV